MCTLHKDVANTSVLLLKAHVSFLFDKNVGLAKSWRPSQSRLRTVTSATSVRCPTQVLFPFSARDSMEPSLETAYERGRISPATISVHQSTQLDECVPRTNIVGPSPETLIQQTRNCHNCLESAVFVFVRS